MLLSAYGVYNISKIIFRLKNNLKYLLVAVLLIAVCYEPLITYNSYTIGLYHNIDESDYENFMWMSENLPEKSVVLTHSWTSNALYPYTHLYVVHLTYYRKNVTTLVDKFIANPCANEQVLKDLNVNYVYRVHNDCNFLTYLGHNTYKYE